MEGLDMCPTSFLSGKKGKVSLGGTSVYLFCDEPVSFLAFEGISSSVRPSGGGKAAGDHLSGMRGP